MSDVPSLLPPPAVPGRRPVFARHAASLLIVRTGPAGPEVLMGRRAAGHRFLPNMLVFPGGAVDPGDRTARAATEPRPDLMALLQRTAQAPLARAIAMAAARELHEETGLSLGTPPRLDTLDYLCRAVTPRRSPIRFNARFLIAPADALHGTAADSHELQGIGFQPVEAALQDKVMVVTAEVLRRLLQWLSLSPLERRDRATLHVFRERGWHQDR